MIRLVSGGDQHRTGSGDGVSRVSDAGRTRELLDPRVRNETASSNREEPR